MAASTTTNETLKFAVFTAYFGPLNEKHDARVLISYEDLSQSWSSANRTLGQQASAHPTATVESVRSSIRQAHREQLDEYQAKARTALVQWATTEWELPPVGSTTSTVEAYTQACTVAAAANRPRWNTSKAGVLAELTAIVEKRAVAAWDKNNAGASSPAKGDKTTTETETGEVKEDTPGSEDEGEVKEDETAEAEASPKAAPPSKPTPAKPANTKTPPAMPKKGGINAKRKAAAESNKQAAATAAPPAKRAATTGAARGAAAGKRGGRQRGVPRGNNANTNNNNSKR